MKLGVLGAANLSSYVLVYKEQNKLNCAMALMGFVCFAVDVLQDKNESKTICLIFYIEKRNTNVLLAKCPSIFI